MRKHNCGVPMFPGDMTCMCQWSAAQWNKQWAIEWWNEAFAPGMRMLSEVDFE